jgi:hypothetical protein
MPQATGAFQPFGDVEYRRGCGIERQRSYRHRPFHAPVLSLPEQTGQCVVQECAGANRQTRQDSPSQPGSAGRSEKEAGFFAVGAQQGIRG